MQAQPTTLRKIPPAFTLIRDLSVGVEALDSLAALALRIQAIRAKRGLSIVPCVAAYDGSDTFEGFNVKVATPPDGASEWVGTVVLPHSQAAQLRAAIQQAGKPLRRAA